MSLTIADLAAVAGVALTVAAMLMGLCYQFLRLRLKEEWEKDIRESHGHCPRQFIIEGNALEFKKIETTLMALDVKLEELKEMASVTRARLAQGDEKFITITRDLERHDGRLEKLEFRKCAV